MESGRVGRRDVPVHLGETGDQELPCPSISIASSGSVVAAVGPIATIRPSSTTTIWSVSTLSLSIGITFTPTNARTVSAAA